MQFKRLSSITYFPIQVDYASNWKELNKYDISSIKSKR